jgi:hypothetical protein
MCALKEYHNLFLRRYVLEKCNLSNMWQIVDFKSVEFRVLIDLKYLSVLRFLELLKSLEGIIGLKLNYRVLGDQYMEIYGFVGRQRLWKFVHSFYNYHYIAALKEIEVFKCGINRGQVLDLELNNFLDSEIPMRLKFRFKLRELSGSSVTMKSIVAQTFCVLGLYKQ